jgi:hypothetical protein
MTSIERDGLGLRLVPSSVSLLEQEGKTPMTTATKPAGVDANSMNSSAAADWGMTTTATEPTSKTAVHARMTPSQLDKIAAVIRVNYLERLLFDGDGHHRHDTSPERADELLWTINELRRQLGWLRLDMQHHHCWPDNA